MYRFTKMASVNSNLSTVFCIYLNPVGFFNLATCFNQTVMSFCKTHSLCAIGEYTGVLSQTFTEQLKIARLRRFYTSSERFLLCAFRAPYQQPRVYYYYYYYTSAEVLKALLTLPPSVCFAFQRPLPPSMQTCDPT